MTFENTGDETLITSLEIESVNEYLSLSDSFFDLEPGKSIDVTLDFIAKTVGNFVGQIIASFYGAAILPNVWGIVVEVIFWFGISVVLSLVVGGLSRFICKDH